MVSIGPTRHEYVKPGYLTALRIQARVINSLVLRELASQFGRRGGGLFLTFLRPMLMTGALAFMRVMLGAAGYGGMAPFPFIACGLIMYRRWREAASDQIGAVSQNRGLLFFHLIIPLDLHVSRLIVSLMFSFIVVVFMYYVARISGLSPPAEEPFYFILLLILVNLLGFGYGLTAACIELFFPAMTLVNMVIMRAMIFISGVFFVVPELPPPVREYFLWNPLLHATELARSYYFIEYKTIYGSLDYVIEFTAGLVIFGLFLQRITRHRVLE